MKQIQAFIRPDKLDPVKEALVALGVNGMTAITVQGFGKQLGHTEVYRGVKIEARLLPKVMLTCVIKTETTPAVLDAIKSAAHTGEVGDGKIIVTPVEDVIRIRTGESGNDALS